MICPECNGRGESIYYVETDRDEISVTVEQRKGICRTCNGSGTIPQTNADRIRAMSIEEFAKVFTQAVCDGCPPKMDWECQKEKDGWDACDACWSKWLKQPAEGGIDYEEYLQHQRNR